MSGETRAQGAQLDLAFAALADPARREMLRLLLQKPRRAGELAVGVNMSPQALSRHLKVLRQAGLVEDGGIAEDARVRLFSVPAQAFEPVQSWVAQAEELWRRQLQSFKSYAETVHRARRIRT